MKDRPNVLFALSNTIKNKNLSYSVVLVFQLLSRIVLTPWPPSHPLISNINKQYLTLATSSFITRPWKETTVVSSHDNQRRQGIDTFNEFLSSGMCLCDCHFTPHPLLFHIQALYVVRFVPFCLKVLFPLRASVSHSNTFL